MNLDDLRRLIKKGGTSDLERDLDQISSSLVDYQSTKYETLIRLLRGLPQNDTSSTTSKQDLTFLRRLLEGVTVERNRIERYKLIRDLIQRLPELGQTLSTYVDNVLSPDDYLKDALVISANDTVKPLVEEVIRRYKIEEHIPLIVAKTLAFGDFFVEIREIGSLRPLTEVLRFDDTFEGIVETEPTIICEVDGSEDDVIDRVLVFWEPDYVVPITYYDYEICYVVVKSRRRVVSTLPSTPNPNEEIINNVVRKIVDFVGYRTRRGDIARLLDENPNLYLDLSTIVSHYIVDKTLENSIYVIPSDKMVYFKIPSALYHPYGESVLSYVLNSARNLSVAEFAMLIYRLTRAPERRIFKIEVGDDRNVTDYIQEIIRKTKQKEVFLQNPVSVDMLVSEMSLFEDYYIPTKDGREYFTVDSIPGGELTSKIDDIEYLRKKVISGTGIPPIYLIQEDSSESKYTLAQENVKFARTITKLQKVLSHPLTKLVAILGRLTFPDKASYFDDIKVSFRPPLAIQVAVLSEIYGNIQTVVDALASLLPNVDRQKLVERYLSSFVSSDEIRDMIRITKLDTLSGKKVSTGGVGGETGEEMVGREEEGGVEF